MSARDDVSTPTEGHNGCGKRASRLFQPTCTSVHEHDHKQMGTQSCPSEYARSLPTESPHLRERSKTLASSQKAPFARAPLWMQSMSTARPTHPGTCTMRFVPDRTRTADEVTPNSATLADLHAGCQALDARCWQQPAGPCRSSSRWICKRRALLSQRARARQPKCAVPLIRSAARATARVFHRCWRNLPKTDLKTQVEPSWEVSTLCEAFAAEFDP